MSIRREEDEIDRAIARMGEVSWLFLQVLHPTQGKSAVQILLAAEEIFREADRKRGLDPSALHYALKRMEQDGLVRQDGQQEVTLPGGRSGFRREMRTVYVITEQGQEALRRHDRLHQVARKRSPLPGFAKLMLGGKQLVSGGGSI